MRDNLSPVASNGDEKKQPKNTMKTTSSQAKPAEGTQSKRCMSTTESRFRQFRDYLKTATGDKAVLFRGINCVHVLANEFSPLRKFRSLQAAIDNFSRYLPVDFVNKF